MKVRPARPADAPDLARVHITAWQHAYRGVFGADYLESLDIDRRESWFRSKIDSADVLLVAEAQNRPIGFCFAGPSTEEGWGEVFAIYVHPERWGQGHGHRLLSAVERELADSGFDKALLWVLESNDRARRFYERQGWRVGKPIRLEEIGGRQVTEVRYERDL